MEDRAVFPCPEQSKATWLTVRSEAGGFSSRVPPLIHRRARGGVARSWDGNVCVRTLRCEEGPTHPLWGAGAVLQKGPVLESGDAVVLEVQLPGRGQRRSPHDSAATTPAKTAQSAIQNPREEARRRACRERPTPSLRPQPSGNRLGRQRPAGHAF